MILFELEELDILFATNPKSGVTSTNHILNVMDVKYRFYGIENPGEINPGSSENIIFVFRDPYQRTVSMFLRFCNTLKSKDERRKKESESLIQLIAGSGVGVTFNQFLGYLSATSELERNLHYRKQDIPKNYKYLIRTHQYKDDFLIAGEALRNPEFSLKIANVNFEAIKSNPSSSTRISCTEDLSCIPSNDLLDKYKNGYPLADSFLNKKNISVIDSVFSEEIEFAKRNDALQRTYF